MMFPPLIMHIRAQKPGKRKVNLWLPLFLLWILLLGLLLLLLPLLVIVLICLPRRWEYLRAAGSGYSVACALRGLRVNVRSDRESVNILCW